MSTTQIAAALFQLQQLDLELDRFVSEQQALLHSLQESPKLRKLHADQSMIQQQLRSDLQAQKEAEWALEDMNRRLRMQEQRLYSGIVVNPKELNALQQEIQHLRTQQSRQEEKTLEVMEAVESLQEQVKVKAETVQQAEEAWNRENAAMMLRRDQLDGRKQELEKKRTQSTRGLNAEVLQRYETMRRTKQGRAISKVEHNSCQWCRVILTPSELQHVRISPELQTCTNCGRILYYDR